MLLHHQLVLTALLAQALVGAAAGIVIPDPAKGEIDGRRAVLFWPASGVDKNGNPVPLPADGCEVHLVPHTDRDRELRQPCGQWFLPAAGQYNVWLEQGDRISATPKVMFHSDVPFTGRGMSTVDVLVEAGRVALERELPLAESLRLVSLDGHLRLGGRGRIFERRVSAAAGRTAVRMPAGKVIAGRFDRATGDAIALSRPLSVVAGKTATVWPAVPPAGSDVLAVIEKPTSARSSKLEKNAPAPQLDGRAPDVLIDGFERLIAIWYAVDAREATMTLRSDAFFLPAQTLALRRGKVTTVRLAGKELPSGRVSIVLPDAMLPPDAKLTVTRQSDGSLVRELSAVAGTQTLDKLPAEALRVVLQLAEWRFTRTFDPSAGEEEARFELDPIRVHGRVFFGDDPAPAEVAFRNGEEWVKVPTDADGAYQALLWYGGRYTVQVTLRERELGPFVEPFRIIERSGAVDFRIPRTDYRIRVVDAATGSPVAGAQASVANIWTNEAGREETLVLRLTTDPDGAAVLPPLREGEVHLEVRADGYADAEPLHFQRPERQARELEIRLRRTRAAASLRLHLSDGRPAAQAEVWALDDALQPLWRGAADDGGEVALPAEAADAFLLVRHREAASTIRRTDVRDWTLAPPAPALTVATGARSARIALWLDGVKLTGVPLAFATWSAVAADSGGTWTARNLPAQAARLVAFTRDDQPSFDVLATAVPYPWPAPVAVRPVD